MTRTVPEQLADLRAGHYAGRGGFTALARDLGVTPLAVKNWRKGVLPRYDHRQTLAALWMQYFTEWPVTCETCKREKNFVATSTSATRDAICYAGWVYHLSEDRQRGWHTCPDCSGGVA